MIAWTLPRSITSPISWIPFVTGSSAVSDLTGSVNSSVPSTKPEKNTDASSNSRRELDHLPLQIRDRGDQHPEAERGQDQQRHDAGEGSHIAEHRHVEPEDQERERQERDQRGQQPECKDLADDELAEPDG